ncbi:MAG: hypothetical protein LBH82_04460 [Bacteroidales bacterium]|nr:hypothetical protein [Bacteroidales bacterium]
MLFTIDYYYLSFSFAGGDFFFDKKNIHHKSSSSVITDKSVSDDIEAILSV